MAIGSPARVESREEEQETTERALPLAGLALSAAAGVHREDTQPGEVRRKPARDQVLERENAFVRRSAAEDVPLL
jgi:hypothetical protein